MASSITPVAVFGSVIIRAFILYTAAGWRWTFYLTIIFNVLSVVLFYLFYFPPNYKMLHTSAAEQRSRWRLLDFGGVLLFTAGMVLLLLGISFGGSLFPWKSKIVITFIVIGFVVLIGFAFWEIYGPADYPFIPMAFFRNRGLMSVILLNNVGYTAFFALLLLYPIQLEALYGTSTMDVGWKSCVSEFARLVIMILHLTLTDPAFVIVGQLLSGSFPKLIGEQKWQMTIWAIALTACTASLGATTPSTPTMFYIFIVLSAMSVGYIENATLTTASFTVKEGDIGIALGLLGTIRGVFAAVGQAIFVAILDTQLASNTPKYALQNAIQAGLPSSSSNSLLESVSSGNYSAVPGLTAQIISAAEYGEKEAYSESFKIVYLAAIAFGAMSIGAAMVTPNFESKFTNKIARRLHTRENGVITGGLESSSAV
jgi:hypothetical protein